jgi:hypothetical protein
MKENFTLRIIRIVSFFIVSAGAIVSLGFVLHAGQNNKSVMLVSLFIIWVLSPFLGLFIANIISTKWPFSVRIALCTFIILISGGSLLFYSGVIPAGTKQAFKFLVIPLISWILIVVFIPACISISRKVTHTNDIAS